MRYLALCLVAILTTGCRDARDLLSLGRALDGEYPGTQVGVTLTDGLILTVTMADSPLLRAPCDSQAVLAMQVATLVRARYPGFDSLQAVHVAFTPARSAEPLSGKAAHLPFRFARTAIRAGLGAADSAAAVDACTAWEELQ
jgi:hypothetical protein